MPFTMTMPKLSPTMEVGTIAKWHKKEGEQVAPGDVIVEVATDKANVEHEALDGGWLRKILVKEGEEAAVNEPIAILTEKKTESIEGYKPEGISEEKPIVKEELKEEEGTKPEEKSKEEKKKASAGAILQPKFIPEAPLKDYIFELPNVEIGKRLKASPLAKKLAKEKGLDLTTVKGTGPGGRIMSADLEKAQKTGVVVFGRREIPSAKPGSYEEETLSPMRKVISQRLQEAKAFIPHFYVTQAVNVEPLMQVRDQLRNVGIKLSYNDFVIRACALALREQILKAIFKQRAQSPQRSALRASA